MNVSAQLGLEYLQAGLIAGGIGLLLVIIYCLIYYRLLGLITILSLILSFGLVFAVLVLLGRWINYSLDMAGVAGLIIAIGITADSFVIYFERIKDEVREGRTFRSAVPRGWIRARAHDPVRGRRVVPVRRASCTSWRSARSRASRSPWACPPCSTWSSSSWSRTRWSHLASGSPIFASPRWSGLGGVAQAGARQRGGERARFGVKEMSA